MSDNNDKWKKVKLGDISETITKGTTPTTIGFDFKKEGVNFIKIESISDTGQFLPEMFKHISVDCNEKLFRSKLLKNDILFSIAGALGRVALVTEDILPANINQALAIIRIPDNVINYQYLFFALKSEEVLKQFEKQKRGNSQQNLSLDDIKNIKIFLPPLEEQDRIVKIIESKLSAVEKVKKIIDEQSAYINALPSSILRKAFNGDY
jgi:type I restriction enzyme S subunit